MSKRKGFKTLSIKETALVRGGIVQKTKEHPWDSDAPTDEVVDSSADHPWGGDEGPWDAD